MVYTIRLVWSSLTSVGTVDILLQIFSCVVSFDVRVTFRDSDSDVNVADKMTFFFRSFQ